MSSSSNQPVDHRPGAQSRQEPDLRTASRRSLWITLAVIGTFIIVEVIAGLVTNSLALLADAGHMITDTIAIGMALIAIWVAGRPASARQTFGFHRTEILAALLNALSLWLIAAWIFVEAFHRFQNPPQAQAAFMLSVGLAGNPVVNDTVGGTPIVVFFSKGTAFALGDSLIASSKDVGATRVYRRVLDGRELTFVADGEGFVDSETGTRWNVLGQAVEGSMARKALEPVVHANHFWFSWVAFKPETRIWRPYG